jgi:hypothetical protein
VYEIADEKNSRLACKAVWKESLKTKKAKTKVCALSPLVSALRPRQYFEYAHFTEIRHETLLARRFMCFVRAPPGWLPTDGRLMVVRPTSETGTRPGIVATYYGSWAK